jgi:hypothetical protein
LQNTEIKKNRFFTRQTAFALSNMMIKWCGYVTKQAAKKRSYALKSYAD